MFTHDAFIEDNKFTISHELVALLLWILDHEEKAFASLIKKAVVSGLKNEISYNTSMHNADLLEEAHNTVMEFFNVMEAHMTEIMHQQSVKKASEKKLLPALEQLDSAVFDDETVRLSIAKATNLPKDSKRSAKEALCKELLRNWNPQKNQVMN